MAGPLPSDGFFRVWFGCASPLGTMLQVDPRGSMLPFEHNLSLTPEGWIDGFEGWPISERVKISEGTKGGFNEGGSPNYALCPTSAFEKLLMLFWQLPSQSANNSTDLNSITGAIS